MHALYSVYVVCVYACVSQLVPPGVVAMGGSDVVRCWCDAVYNNPVPGWTCVVMGSNLTLACMCVCVMCVHVMCDVCVNVTCQLGAVCGVVGWLVYAASQVGKCLVTYGGL